MVKKLKITWLGCRCTQTKQKCKMQIKNKTILPEEIIFFLKHDFFPPNSSRVRAALYFRVWYKILIILLPFEMFTQFLFKHQKWCSIHASKGEKFSPLWQHCPIKKKIQKRVGESRYKYLKVI